MCVINYNTSSLYYIFSVGAKICVSIFCQVYTYMVQYMYILLIIMKVMDISVFLEKITSFYTSPVFVWTLLCFAGILCIWFFLHRFPKSIFSILFDMLFEVVAKFYGDILGEQASHRIKTYIVTLFFVIFIANILGVLIDFIAPVFWITSSWDFHLAQYIILPTADMQFNISLAIFSTILLIYIQFRSLGFGRFFYNYVPILWKGYIVIERGNMHATLYYPVFCVAKVADIIISLFLWFLDIVGLFAKIISLGFRLFGNMTSGTVLVWMLIVGVSSMSQSMTELIGGVNFPIIAPIIVYLQSFLVACIQAMVFPLLVAIFIRMAQIDESSSQQIGA